MSIIRMFVVVVMLVTFNALRAQTTAPTDPTTLAPADANVLPSVEEARQHLGNPTPDPQIALWISDNDPEVLFIAVRLDKPRELRASSGGDDLKISPIGAPSELIYAAAS